MGAAATSAAVAGVTPPEVARAFLAQLAVFQACLLCASALHKAARRAQLRAVLREFAAVPDALAPATLAAIIGAELWAAIWLILPAHRVPGALLAAAIWTGYLLLIVRAIRADRRGMDCGCSFGPVSRPLGAIHVARNAVLAGVALLVWAAERGAEVPLQPSQLLGGVALLALYAALDQVMGLRPLPRGEIL
jgi:hypothetical protein